MATAVVEVELLDPPARIGGLDGYAAALVLARLGGRPVGQATLPVVEGSVDVGRVHEAIVTDSNRPLWDRWLQLRLGIPDPEPAVEKATVAVCTRDRPDDLRRCLDALYPYLEAGHELLVVDNRPSTRETERVVAMYDGVRYVREDRQGLSAAGNRAFREASHEVVAFADDDTVPDPGWLPALLRNFSDPLVLCVTGLTMPLELETEAQEWFERYSPFGRGFERVVLDGTQMNPLASWRAGAGANMAFRRSAVDRVGPFEEVLGSGTPARSGGDHEYFARILAAGYRIVYEPAALSWHRHRRTWEELRRTVYGYGVGVYASWTHELVVGREFGVLKMACGWLIRDQLPALVRSLLRRPGRVPLDLLLAELRGCVAGPWAYLASRRVLPMTGGWP